MRCFIAINLPEEVKEEISKIIEKLPKKGIKKVAKENLHLTLKFLGEINENLIKKIEEELEKIKFDRFAVKLKDIGFFPNRNFIRVVWLGIDEGEEEIKELQKEVDKKLAKLFKKEKNFEPHLTIARVKFLKDKEGFIEELEKIKFEDSFEVRSFELMESILQRKGPVYKLIKSFKLE
jgi:2'-5' RNA ligase